MPVLQAAPGAQGDRHRAVRGAGSACAAEWFTARTVPAEAWYRSVVPGAAGAARHSWSTGLQAMLRARSAQ